MKAAAHVTQLSANMIKPQYVRNEIPNKLFYYELRKNYIIVQKIPNIYVLITNKCQHPLFNPVNPLYASFK